MAKLRPVDYIIKLSQTDSRNAKEAILRDAAVSGCINLFKGIRLAYDKRRVFNVKQVPEIQGDFEPFELDALSNDFNWDKFIELVKKLENRELTGNAARDALHQAAEVACINEWNHWYRRILMKDLRCGITETTVNNVLKEMGKKGQELMIPVWKVQLADDAKKHPKKMVGKKAIDPKLDGMRLTTVLDTEVGTVRMFSRNGKENTNFSDITTVLEKLLPDLPGSLVLDGEVVSSNFQQLMTQANRKENVDTSDSHYALFDVLSLVDFEAGKSNTPQMDRQQVLADLAPVLREISDGKVYVIPKLLVDLDTKEGKEKMNEFYQETLDAGYEGIMVKDVNAPYECKRTRHWLKWKPVDSVDLEVVDFEEGTGRNNGRLGALICEGTENGEFVRVNVGGGYSDSQRDEFWSNRQTLIGEIIEIEFDPDNETRFTKSKEGEHWSLRFPRFKRFRSVNNGGKI